MPKVLEIENLKIQFVPAGEIKADPLKLVVKTLTENPEQAAEVVCRNRTEAAKLRSKFEQSAAAKDVIKKSGYRLEIQNAPSRKSFFVSLAKPADVNVNFVPVGSLPKPPTPKYQFILESLLAKPGQAAVIVCKDEEEAKELSRGFHSSGTGRRLKREGYGIIARRAEDDDKVVHVYLKKGA